MAAMTAQVTRQRKGIPKSRRFLMTNSITIPKGALVANVTATGLVTNAVDTAGNPVVGGAAETKVSGTGGADWITVDYDAEWLFAATSITQAMMGTAMEVVDNNTVDETAGAGNIVAGTLTGVVSTTLGWDYIPGLTF